MVAEEQEEPTIVPRVVRHDRAQHRRAFHLDAETARIVSLAERAGRILRLARVERDLIERERRLA